MSAPTRRRPAAARPPAPAGRSVVLVGDHAVLGSGAVLGRPPAEDLSTLLDRVSHAFEGREGVVLLDGGNAARFRVPGAEAVLEEAGGGWKARPFGSGWTKARHPHRGMLVLGLLDQLDPDLDAPYLSGDRFPLATWLLDDDEEGAVLDPWATTEALDGWQRVTGRPWHGRPGIAGWDVLEAQLRALRITVHFKSGKAPGDAYERALSWTAPADDSNPVPYPYVHGYDLTRMYGAALGVAEFCPWSLRPEGPRAFDRKLAGWWLIDVPPWSDPRLPDPAGYPMDPDAGARRWVTTPTAALLEDLADAGRSGGFEVLDAYVGSGKRLFREFAGLMERGYLDAAAAGQTGLAAAFKAAGAREVFGLMNTGAGRFWVHRPDWHHTVIAQARANLWRKIDRVASMEGRYPMRRPATGKRGRPSGPSVETDCVYYGSDNPDPLAAAPRTFKLGDALGAFKHHRTEAAS